MKTNSSTRRLAKLQDKLGWLALLAMVALEAFMAYDWCCRPQSPSLRSCGAEQAWTPNVGACDFFIAGR